MCLGAALAVASACSVANAPDDPIAPEGGGMGGTDAVGGMGGMTGGEPVCGDGVVNGDEACDDSGETASCDDDCTAAECGDSVLNVTAGEQCDAGGETELCNDNCTTAQCGDALVNMAAGEECDDADAISAGCCSSDSCTFTQNCSAPTPIMLSDNGMGQAVGTASCPLGGMGEVAAAPCDGNPSIGGGAEHVYEITITEPGSLEINVNATFDAVVRFMSAACDTSSEIPEGPTADGCSNQGGANTTESLSYNVLVPGSYFLVVDAAGPDEVGTFDVQVINEPLNNPILNPSFESQSYMGWTLLQTLNEPPSFTIMMVQPAGAINQGQTYVDLFDNQSGSSTSPSLPFNVAPSDGQFAAVWISDGPDNRRMYQDLTITGPTLQFDMAHFNADGIWDTGSQHIAINIRNPATDAVLATPFITDGAFPVTNPTMTTYTVDLSMFLGQTVRLDVEVQGQNFFLDAVFDNFVIL